MKIPRISLSNGFFLYLRNTNAESKSMLGVVINS